LKTLKTVQKAVKKQKLTLKPLLLAVLTTNSHYTPQTRVGSTSEPWAMKDERLLVFHGPFVLLFFFFSGCWL